MNNIFDTTNRLVTVCMLKFKIASLYHYSHLIYRPSSQKVLD